MFTLKVASFNLGWYIDSPDCVFHPLKQRFNAQNMP